VGNDNNSTIFDTRDIDYLASNLDDSQLKSEAHKAEIEVAVCRQFGEYSDELYWSGYAEACKEALKLRLRNRPKPKPVPGKIDINDVKSSIDIVEVAERYTKLKEVGKYLNGLCPIHSERHASFFVYPERQDWYCYGCCKGGDIVDLIMAIEGLDFKQVLTLLSQGIDILPCRSDGGRG